MSDPSEKAFDLTICRRSGQPPVDCGLDACEYGCDDYDLRVVPVRDMVEALRDSERPIRLSQAQADWAADFIEREFGGGA